MRIFTADNVLTDWTHGMIVVVCESEEDIADVLTDHDELSAHIIESVIRHGDWQDMGEAAGDPRVVGICWGGA